MPWLTKTACRCGGVRSGGNCDRCGHVRGKRDGTTTERGYGSDWQRVSRYVRQTNPLCVECQKHGRVRAATEVHHIVPIVRAPHLRLELSNLVSVCRSCHEELERGA